MASRKKILMMLLDGYGDVRYRELGGKTPLEYARTPNMDALCGKRGLLVPAGLGSEIPIASASLILFSNLGYDARKVKPRRGPVEGGVGARVPFRHGDLLVRGNFCHIDKERRIIDLRAGRIKDTHGIVRKLNAALPPRFRVYSTGGYRCYLVIHDKRPLSQKITEVDPHAVGKKVMHCRPLTHRNARAVRSAELVNEFMDLAQQILHGERSNFILLRGFGTRVPRLRSFGKKFSLRAAAINGMNVNKGICKLIGMRAYDVPEELGGWREVEVKRRPIAAALKKYDFVFVHFKNTDEPGHDGKLREKVHEIEMIDRFIGTIGIDLDKTLVVITSDHCTPCSLKSHSTHPIPTLISGPGESRKFGERWCTDFRVPSHRLMSLVLKSR